MPHINTFGELWRLLICTRKMEVPFQQKEETGPLQKPQTVMSSELLHHPEGQRMQPDITVRLLKDGINTEGRMRLMGRFASREAICPPSVGQCN